MKSSKYSLLLVALTVICAFWAASNSRAEGNKLFSFFHQDEKNPLADYIGQNRVMLIYASSIDDPAYTEQLKFINNAKDKQNFEERLLTVRPVLKGSPAAKELARLYNDAKFDFAVVLIGKDGNAVARYTSPVRPGTLYSVIDGMPMRREEMKRHHRAKSSE